MANLKRPGVRRRSGRFGGAGCIAVGVLSVALASVRSAESSPPGVLTPAQIAGATVAISCRTQATPGGFIGTGMVVHESGYVLTSTTVVPPKAVDIRCSFLTARNLPARLVIADEKLELAVIKVKPPEGTPALPIGDSRSVRVGQTVFTVGDAYRAFARSGRFTTSLGIISGIYELTRQIAPQPVYVGRVLETTATVAPGMDGGPLLDGSGRLVGLLSLNVSEARWLGVAVPIDAVQERLEQAIAEDAKAQPGESAGQVKLTFAETPAPPLFGAQQGQDETFRLAAEKIAPSVVAIEVDRKTERTATTGPGPQRRPRRPRRRPAGAYKDFFKRPKTPVTGLLVSSDGYVLTSYFNVWGTLNSIHVILPDGRRLGAKLLGHNEAKDLAMLKVEAKGLPAATFAWTGAVLATPIATVGRSPDPAAITITRGIISATGRLDGTTLQIDAETNYGNAGAPVIDARGRCVGLVTHVRPDTIWGQNSGVGFATKASAIRPDLGPLRAGKAIPKPKRGFLGVVMSGGHIDIKGVVVERVQDNGPADEAGIEPKDIILRVDGKMVADAADLANIVQALKPGTEVKLTVKRGQTILTIDVVLGEHPYR